MGHIVLEQENALQPVADLANQLSAQISQRRQQRQQQELALRQYVMETGLPVSEEDMRRLAPLVDRDTFLAWQNKLQGTGVLGKQQRKAKLEEAQIAGAEAQTESMLRQTKAIDEQMAQWEKRFGLDQEQAAFVREHAVATLNEAIASREQQGAIAGAQLGQQKELSEKQMDLTRQMALFSALTQAYTTNAQFRMQVLASQGNGAEFYKVMAEVATGLEVGMAKLGVKSFKDLEKDYQPVATMYRNLVRGVGQHYGVDPAQAEASVFGAEQPEGPGWFKKALTGVVTTVSQRAKQASDAMGLGKTAQTVAGGFGDATSMLFPGGGQVAAPAPTPLIPAPTIPENALGPVPGATNPNINPLLFGGLGAGMGGQQLQMVDPNVIQQLFAQSLGVK